MSSTFASRDSVDALWEVAVSGEIIDGISDGVALRTHPADRAEVVVGIVEEIFEAVAGRCADTANTEELRSLRRIVDEAQAHHNRMPAHSTPGSAVQVRRASTNDTRNGVSTGCP
jgi:hypothetical protein